MKLTDAASSILSHVEKMEFEHQAISERLGQHLNKLVGTVRISSVPFIVNRVLIPNLRTFQSMHPDLTVELVPEARNIDLTKREADLAVRFSRPSEGGFGTKAKKIGDMEFAVFCSSAVNLLRSSDSNKRSSATASFSSSKATMFCDSENLASSLCESASAAASCEWEGAIAEK